MSIHHEGAAGSYRRETLAVELPNRLPVAFAAWLPNEVLAVGSRRGVARKGRERADTGLQSDLPAAVRYSLDEGASDDGDDRCRPAHGGGGGRRRAGVAELRVRSGPKHVERLMQWAERFPERRWAIENATGLGYLLRRAFSLPTPTSLTTSGQPCCHTEHRPRLPGDQGPTQGRWPPRERRATVRISRTCWAIAVLASLGLPACFSGGAKMSTHEGVPSSTAVAGSAPICQADGGAQLCLVPRQGTTSYQMRASGFMPNSDVRLELTGPAVGTPAGEPKPIRVDADGKYPPANGSGGLVVPAGSGPVTVTISGTAVSGKAVVLPVSVSG